MFANECLGELKYEATTAAVFMAGLFLSFLVDYIGARFILWRQSKKEIIANIHVDVDTGRSAPTSSDKTSSVTGAHAPHIHRTAHVNGTTDEKLGVVVLEAGIVFHSLCMCSPSLLSLFKLLDADERK
jgi:zinc transporter 1/2/3